MTLSKIGDVKVRWHRPLVGQVKTVTIKRDVNHWYVTCSCEVEDEPLPACVEAVGIDLGLLVRRVKLRSSLLNLTRMPVIEPAVPPAVREAGEAAR